MEQHRKNPSCTSCHRVIDPLGLALENFDVTGAWRIKDNEVPVDAVGDLYDGTKMDGPAGLRAALLKHQDMFLTSFTESLLTYALGRRVEYTDMPMIRAIVRDAGEEGQQAVGVRAGRRQQPRLQDGCGRHGQERDDARPTSRESDGRGAEHVSHAEAAVPPHRPQGRRRHHGVAVPRGDGPGAARRPRPRAARSASPPSRWCTAPPAAPRSASRRTCGRRPRSAATSTCRRAALAPLEPFRDDITIVSNTDVRNAEAFTAPEIGGDHFRSSAVFLTQMHPKQTQGSDVLVGTSLDQYYAQHNGQDDGDSVDAAVHRERRPGGRLLLRLLVHLHRLDQLGRAGSAAADDSRPAHGVRSAVRRRRDAGRAQGAPRRRQEHPRLARHRGGAAQQEPRRRRPRAAGRLPRRRARDRAPHPAGRSVATATASRASCPARRSACPTRSRSTSS